MTTTLDRLNERTAFILNTNFLDEYGAPQEPISATYQIRCNATDTDILLPTEISPISESVLLKIKSSESEMTDETKEYEEHQITVVSNNGPDDEITEVYEYVVLNLQAL